MKVVGWLSAKTRLPTPEGQPQNGGFYCPLDVNPGTAPLPDRVVSGREDGRIVHGELSEDRSEVCYSTRWGKVSIPYVTFAWILELPVAAKEKAR